MNFKNLPENWKVVRLGRVAKVFGGSSAPQDKRYFKNGKYSFVRVQDLANCGRTSVSLLNFTIEFRKTKNWQQFGGLESVYTKNKWYHFRKRKFMGNGTYI